MEFKNLILAVIGRFLVASDRAGWGLKGAGRGAPRPGGSLQLFEKQRISGLGSFCHLMVLLIIATKKIYLKLKNF